MNLSLTDIKRGLLQVPKSTLAADTRNSLRPSLENAVSSEIRKNLFHQMCSALSTNKIMWNCSIRVQYASFFN